MSGSSSLSLSTVIENETLELLASLTFAGAAASTAFASLLVPVLVDAVELVAASATAAATRRGERRHRCQRHPHPKSHQYVLSFGCHLVIVTGFQLSCGTPSTSLTIVCRR